jgi:GTP cyclohydrolase II
MKTPSGFEVVKAAEADFPSEYGLFRIYGFEGHFPKPDGSRAVEEAAVLVMGDPAAEMPGLPAPLMRIHSQCLTGDAFHSLRCDCRAQLEIALKQIGEEGRGVLIYELQEGRGIGLMNKLRAYELQDRGADTVEANEQLGFESDLRSYLLPGAILRYLGITSVRLLSNNPGKVKAVEEAGIVVADRVPCVAPPVKSSQAYLRTKREKMGHLLDHP